MFRGERAEELFFDRLLSNEDENLHRLFLTHAVGSRDALFQDCRVPRKVDIDHGVCRLQVQSGRARVCRQEQTALGIVLKLVDQSLPEFLRHRTVKANKAEVAFLEERLDQVEHLVHSEKSSTLRFSSENKRSNKLSSSSSFEEYPGACLSTRNVLFADMRHIS